MIIPFKSKSPEISPGAYIVPTAAVIGDVTLDDECSVWFNAVIRGDVCPITIGKRSNIQDNVVIHTSWGHNVEIGQDVSVGHSAVLHGCKIGNNVLIGMNATVLDGADIGENCIIGAKALIAPGKKIPPGCLVLGVPGKMVRKLTAEDIAKVAENADVYVQLIKEYKMAEDE